MKFSEYNNKTLMLAFHQQIEEHADYASEKLEKGETEDLLSYPPNCGFTDKEERALEKLESDPELRSALRKILADNSARVIFEFLNYLDGTTDPDENLGKWTGITLVDNSDLIEQNGEMLHDSFYSSYWDWKEIRPKIDWQLDTFEE